MTDDIISRQATIDAIKKCVQDMREYPLPDGLKKHVAENILKDVPTIDAVEVVRCKDCKHRVYTDDGESNPDDIVCDLWETDGLTEADYCSRSERRTDAD